MARYGGRLGIAALAGILGLAAVGAACGAVGLLSSAGDRSTAWKSLTPSPSADVRSPPPEPVATTPLPVAPSRPASPYTISCFTTDYQNPTFLSLEETWSSPQQLSACDVSIDPSYEPSATERRAIASYLKFVATEDPISALETMLGICVEDAAAAGAEPSMWNRSVLAGALLLCPTAPNAAAMRAGANGTLFADGNHVVGKDITAGVYRTAPEVRDCYWERTSRSGNTIANNFVTFAAQGVTVRIVATDGSFSSERCGTWTKVG